MRASSDAKIANTGTISILDNGTALRIGGRLALTNTGTIATGNSTNAAYATAAISTSGAATVVNDGTIEAGTTGPTTGILAAGPLTLANSGSISGATGVRVTGGATGSSIVDTGTIVGTGGTAIQLTSAADTLAFGAHALVGGLVRTGGGGDAITIDGSGTRMRIMAFDTLKNATVTVTGTDRYAIVGNTVITGGSNSNRIVDRGVLDVRDGVGDLLRERLANPARRSSSDPLGGLWIQGFGGTTTAATTTEAAGFTTKHAGAVAGFEDNTLQNLHVGVFAGGAEGSGTDKANGDAANGTYGVAGLYGRWTPGAVVIDADVVAGRASDRRHRDVLSNLSPSGVDTLSGTARGTFVSPSVGVGIRLPVDDVTTLTPGVRVRYLAARWSGGSETGLAGEPALADSARSQRNLETRAQIAAEHRIAFANGVLVLSETMGGLHQMQSGSASSIATLGTTLALGTADASRIWGAFGTAGFEWRTLRGASLYASVQGEWHTDRSLSARGRTGAIWRF